MNISDFGSKSRPGWKSYRRHRGDVRRILCSHATLLKPNLVSALLSSGQKKFIQGPLLQVLLITAVALSIVLPFQSLYASGENTKTILVLNSYHKGFPWTDNIVKGIESVVNVDLENVELVVEYMDTKAMGFGEEYKSEFYDLFYYKYKEQNFDIIISSDDNAFNFLKEFHESLFPGVPIVVCGVNNRNAPDIVDPSIFTGILESTSHEETIELILHLHPETKKIYLVIDTTPSGNYRWRVTEPSFKRFKEIEFIRISDEYSITEIENLVGGLENDSAVIFFTLYRDSSGEYISMQEGVTRLSKASARPIYTTHLLELPYGVVGGKVLGGFYHGQTVAAIAMRIINGEDIRNIPFLLRSPTQYIFDYGQLERWNIKHSDLPEESIILNEPFSIYAEYKIFIWGCTVTIICLLLIIFLLQVNILKRKHAEKAQVESERKYRALFEKERNAIFIYDPETMIIIDANPAASALYGYSHDELIGMNCLNFSAEDDAFIEASSHAVTEDEMDVSPRWHKKKNGTVFPLELDIYAIEIMGNIRGYAVARDITKQKELEAKLIQVHKMEAIGTLAGGIAHDFNNILSSIIGFTELALQDAQKGSDQEDDLKEVYIAGNRAKELVKQILAFARQSEEELKSVRPDKIIEEIVKLLRPSTPSSIQISVTLESRSHILVNPSQFHQVVMNLCSNSIYALQTNGDTLEIVLRDIAMPDETEESPPYKNTCIELCISDNGPGIEVDVIDNIFEPYYTTKGLGEGTGMGLAMAKGIVESWGGKITVQSKPLKKTTFTVVLPISTGGDLESSTLSESYPHGTEHVLLVDDEPPIAKMGSRILEDLGYTVTMRTSSVEALELFKDRSDEIELVISDMTMPDMTGDELSLEIRKIQRDIPIILCTGYSNKMNNERAQQIGINAFAYKPFTKSDFAKTVREVLDAP